MASTALVAQALTPLPAVAVAPTAWCDVARVWVASDIPEELPFSQCPLTDHVITAIPGGPGVHVPPPGGGAAVSAGEHSLAVWSDEYAAHVGEAPLDVMRRYAGRLATAPPGIDRARLGSSLARYVNGTVGVRAATVESTAQVLDAADAVRDHAASASGPTAASAAALDVVRGHLDALGASGRDERPDVTSLRRVLQDMLVDTDTNRDFSATQANRYLAALLVLRAYSGARRDLQGGSVDDAISTMRSALSARTASVRLPSLPSAIRTGVRTVADGLAGGDAGSVSEEGVPDAGSPGACADSARTYFYPGSPPPHWPVGFEIPWKYNYTNQFPRYSATGYSQALGRAFNGVTGLSDDCGYAWHPNIGNDFTGFTTSITPDASSGDCVNWDATDGWNVIGWSPAMPVGAAGGYAYAYACAFLNPYTNVLFETDLVMSTAIRWDIPELDASIGYACSPAAHDLDVQGAMTHEFGHSVGQGHVAEATHGRLTMSTTNDAWCGRGERTLGRGDAIGLSSMYGQVQP